MSALPPKADIAGRQSDVRFVPKADIAATRVRQRPCRREQISNFSHGCSRITSNAFVATPCVPSRLGYLLSANSGHRSTWWDNDELKGFANPTNDRETLDRRPSGSQVMARRNLAVHRSNIFLDQ
jgi:hypothetical protein